MLDMIKRIISAQLGVDESDITESTRIVDDLGADSLDVVEMLMGIESECGISVPDDVAATLETVGDVVKYLEENK
ncbi:MAG: acyl carrier protein [Clostridia bacterium]|nr:acyl carrier protein [Clostridia bacterium]